MAIYFSDIENFTSISEKYGAQELVAYLRDYLSAMSHPILDFQGFINKYEGDAIMALWGVFGKQETSIFDACHAAVEQKKQLRVFNQKRQQKGFSAIRMRVGIHYGEVIIGNIGAEGRKIEFTAL